jgi:DNA (cytosine-5)-methyltransferase 1
VSLLFAQPFLPVVHEKMIVDLFAGGGGASSGIEQATGRMVDVAVNHNRIAVELHKANHPQTVHFHSDVFEVDPKEVTGGRPVGLLWASPDCTYHSKARGSKPIRHESKKRRALAWVVTRWAGQVQPDVIMLENVEEFAQWGPLRGKDGFLRPHPGKRGKTFRRWVWSLREHGYKVEWRELKACDYGAPTIRKRLFVIARRDGLPIVWPEPTHGTGLKPFRTAAECIDWSIPMLSIFATKEEAKEFARVHNCPAPVRPLAENTMRRCARGVDKFVLKNPKPFLVKLAHGAGSGKSQRWGDGCRSVTEPITTLTATGDDGLVCPIIGGVGGRAGQSGERSGDSPFHTITAKADTAVFAPILATYHDEGEGAARGATMDRPIPTIDTSNRHALVAAFLGQNNGGFYEGSGVPLDAPLPTIMANGRGHNPIIAAHIQRDFGTSTGQPADSPLGTITSEGGGKAALVYSFLQQYNGTSTGQTVDTPINTITSLDRFALVTVKKERYVIQDVLMRMLQPKELYLCQGFRPGYIIDRCADGTPITKTEQVKMVGNSVSPPVAEALVRANCEHLIARDYREVRKRRVA